MLRTKRISRCSDNAKLMDLPIDILINILLRLPAKSLCCAQCVCKTLLHIVEARSFATLVHLRLLTTASDAVAEVPQLLLLNVAQDGDNGSLITISPSQIYDGNVLTKSRHGMVSKIASCRYGYNVGFVFCNLFFFKDKKYDRDPCFIFNPLRGEVLMLPTSKVQVPHSCRRNMLFTDWYGMGFDDITNTYKIARVSGNERCCLLAQVYILGTSSWKRISLVPPCNLSTKKISAYGDLHWLINRTTTGGQICIVSFDFKKEEFYLTPHPALRKPEYSFLSLHFVNLRGSMAIVDTSSHTHIDIWVLKSNEKKEWVRDYSVNLELPAVERPWHLDRCGTCIGEWENGIFFVEFYVTTNAFFVDTRCDSVKRVSLGGSDYTRIFSYPGSLISLKDYGNLIGAEAGNWRPDFSEKSWQID
nr:MYB transcription factor protein [Rosa persica]